MKQVIACTAALWIVNAIWLANDTRPPVWDMAMHQMYALNYVPGFAPAQGLRFWQLSGNYPPFVHLVTAAAFRIFQPSPRIAAMANIPATFLLFWALYELAGYFTTTSTGAAARWACVLTLLTPYLIWMSRETILDYWLSAWIAAAWVFLIRTEGFQSRGWSRLFGVVSALGLLTKWLFAGFMAFPFLAVSVRYRIWKDEERLVNAAQSLIIAAAIAGVWYAPNLVQLIRYFRQNAQIGALEGEPPVFSFQSFIYYLRLLEGYQVYALLFLLVAGGVVFVIRRSALRDSPLYIAIVAGGWLAMTLLRTKDPRFTMPLLAPLLIIPGVWLASWSKRPVGRFAQVVVLALLIIQAYAANFGISWLPQQVVLAEGYQGSLRWDWHLYSQNYFDILGAPRREDWKQKEILQRVAEEARNRGAAMSLALVPDLSHFDFFNFQLAAKLAKMPVRVDHIASAARGLSSFDGYDFVVTSQMDQGMSWTTKDAQSLNQLIMDRRDIFKPISSYHLPNGDTVRLYFIERS